MLIQGNTYILKTFLSYLLPYFLAFCASLLSYRYLFISVYSSIYYHFSSLFLPSSALCWKYVVPCNFNGFATV